MIRRTIDNCRVDTVYTLAVRYNGVVVAPSRPINVVDCEPLECGIGEAILAIKMPISDMDNIRLPILGDGEFRTMTFRRETCAAEPCFAVPADDAIIVWKRTA